jgi:adenosylhomocysteine nucleosidase
MLFSAGGRPGTAGTGPFRFVLLAALPLEVRPFLRQYKARRLAEVGLPAWEFDTGEGRGALALTGMGKEYAEKGVKRVLDLWHPEILVSLGFSGAVRPGLAPGHLVLGESFWHYYPQTERLEEVEAPAPRYDLKELARRLDAAGLPIALGSCVTTAGIIHKGRDGEPLRRLAHPVLDLETAALATAAAATGTPFLALRVITDAAGEEIPDFLREGWKPGYGPSLATALGWLVRDLRRLEPMLHLWRRSRLGAQRLAAGLHVILPLI